MVVKFHSEEGEIQCAFVNQWTPSDFMKFCKRTWAKPSKIGHSFNKQVFSKDFCGCLTPFLKKSEGTPTAITLTWNLLSSNFFGFFTKIVLESLESWKMPIFDTV